jgi:hypothetical protein
MFCLTRGCNAYEENPFKLVNFDISPTSASNLPDGNILLWIGITKGSFGQSQDSKTTNYQIIKTDGTDLYNGVAKQIHLGEMFCTGTSNLPNGNILINGGSNMESTIIFNYKTKTFEKTDPMDRPRGYNANSVTTDNRVFTLGGEWGPYGDRNVNYHGEIITIGYNNSNQWKSLVNVSGSITGKVDAPNEDQSNQNHMWLFSFKGKNNMNYVFKAGPTPNMHLINVNDGTMRFVGKRGSDVMGIQGTAVQYAPGKILTLSGDLYQDSDGKNFASKDAYIIDINPLINNTNTRPRVIGPISRQFNRVTHNALVLPGGRVFIFGGQSKLFKWSELHSILNPEYFDPATNQFISLNSKLNYARNYHSTALLLKDGRVLIAGSGSGSCDQPTEGCPTRFNGEIYTPPYLQNIKEIDRPLIQSAVNNFGPGCVSFTLDLRLSRCKIFKITISNKSCGNNGITGCSFELLRLSSVTHSTNNDQLRIPLNLNSKISFNKGLVSIPELSLPFVISGYYHLFAINKATGTPSVAVIINVNRQ